MVLNKIYIFQKKQIHLGLCFHQIAFVNYFFYCLYGIGESHYGEGLAHEY